MNRRKFLQAAAAGTVATSALSTLLTNSANAASAGAQNIAAVDLSRVCDEVLAQTYPFTLPALGYDNAAVEPAVDAMTMSIQHDTDHAAYVTNLNKALETQPTLQKKTLRELLTSLSGVPDAARNGVRISGGGHANHAMFWQVFSPGGAKAPSGALLAAIKYTA